jgi:hypothetical protein
LIIVALVAAWLLVLVPIVARRRQEVARTADSALAARVVRSGGVSCSVEEEFSMSDSGDPDTARDRGGIDYADELDEFDEELEGLGDADEEAAVAEPDQVEPDAAEDEDDFADEAGYDGEDDLAGYDDAEYDDVDYDEYEDERGESRPYRPGRGGFDPEAAALTARAKYANRQRVVVFILVLAVVSALAGGLLMPLIWWVHGIVDATFVGYLTYLRRQVRIEEEIRDRRTARMGGSRRLPAPARQRRPRPVATEQDAPAAPQYQRPVVVAQRPHPGTVVVEADDEDPMFDELDEPDVLPYRRAVGE